MRRRCLWWSGRRPEGCDAGADNGPYAACTDACLANVCGDGKVHAGVEGCDEGAGNVDTGYCRSDCQLGVCGDGFVFAGPCAAWSSADELKSARVGFNAVAPGDAAALAEWKAKRQWVSHSNRSCDLSQQIDCIEAY